MRRKKQMFKNIFGKVLTALLISTGIVTPSVVQAAAWDGGDWPKQVEGRVIEYLVITANYESPRALAMAIQDVTRNPVLLLPAANTDSSIFLILPDGKAPAKVDPDQLSAFISGLNPKRIIVIGNSSIVPDEYRLAINKKYEVINLDSQSWVLNAISASNLFNTNKIEKQFDANRKAVKEAEEKTEEMKKTAGKTPASEIPNADAAETETAPPAEKTTAEKK